jgi:hypothetical protein
MELGISDAKPARRVGGLYSVEKIMTCPHCQLRYDDFRTGWTFADVRATFWREHKPWHPARRRSVLGRWHEIKQEMWAEHIKHCENFEYRDIDYEREEY